MAKKTAQRIRVNNTYGQLSQIDLKPGMGWAVYMDKGPTGICGQSMDTTCPHTEMHTWPDADSMRADLKSKTFFRNGARHLVMYGVVDDWTAAGVFTIVVH